MILYSRLPEIGDKYRVIKPFEDWTGDALDMNSIATLYDFEVPDDGLTSYFLRSEDGNTEVCISAATIDECMELVESRE